MSLTYAIVALSISTVSLTVSILAAYIRWSRGA